MNNYSQKVNPEIAIKHVFIFNIAKTINEGKSIYDATRSSWRVSKKNSHIYPAFAVGLENKISIGSFEISEWTPDGHDPKRYEFTSLNHPNPASYIPLLGKDWANIFSIDKVKDFFGYGQHIIIEFNGQGQFRIERGSPDKTTWHNCI